MLLRFLIASYNTLTSGVRYQWEVLEIWCTQPCETRLLVIENRLNGCAIHSWIGVEFQIFGDCRCNIHQVYRLDSLAIIWDCSANGNEHPSHFQECAIVSVLPIIIHRSEDIICAAPAIKIISSLSLGENVPGVEVIQVHAVQILPGEHA